MYVEYIKRKLYRFLKCLVFRKGIYGKVGKKNRFMKDVYIDEKCEVGNYNFFNKGATITGSKIGNYCSIAPNVTIGPGEHDLANVSTKINVMQAVGVSVDLLRGECIVGSDVWIGTNAVVCRGVKVGNGAVIAAGAVVITDVPDYAVFGGVPAKLLKYRFDAETRTKLLESAWFEKPNINEAAELVRNLQKEVFEEKNCATD